MIGLNKGGMEAISEDLLEEACHKEGKQGQ
jgi:hypothetical protein